MSEKPVDPMPVEEAIERAERTFAVITRAVETTKYEYINGLHEIERSRKENPKDIAGIIYNTANELSRLGRLAELLEESMIPFLYALLFHWTTDQQEFDDTKERIAAHAENERMRRCDDTDLFLPGDQICPIDSE